VRVLLVEDDPDIAQGVQTALRRAGYEVEWCADGDAGEEAAMLHSFGVILLDWMLPGRSGIEICRTLREMEIATPILMLTARDAVADRVAGLDGGADDYLVKPFSVEELLARVRALARRESAVRSSVVRVADLEIDTKARIVRQAGQVVSLTPRELSLLEALAQNPGRVLTREAILERVWNNDEALPNTVNFHMASLRKKVDPAGRLIRTVHGLGYTLESKEDPSSPDR